MYYISDGAQIYFLDNLPQYTPTRVDAMSGTKEPALKQTRKMGHRYLTVPRHGKQHDVVPAVLWQLGNEPDQVTETDLGLNDLQFQCSVPDKGCPSTIWDVFEVYHRKPREAYFWKFHCVSGQPQRVLAERDCFHYLRETYLNDQPQLLVKVRNPETDSSSEEENETSQAKESTDITGSELSLATPQESGTHIKDTRRGLRSASGAASSAQWKRQLDEKIQELTEIKTSWKKKEKKFQKEIKELKEQIETNEKEAIT